MIRRRRLRANAPPLVAPRAAAPIGALLVRAIALACGIAGIALAFAQVPGTSAGTAPDVPSAPVAADTPTGLPYGDPRGGPWPAAADAAGAPAPIGSPGWSIALHYGASPPLDELRAFDVVVLDPDHVADPDAHRRRSLGRSEPFAYVSVGEIHPSRAHAADAPPGLLRDTNPDWGGRVVDQSHPEWPRFLVERVFAPLWARGWRGFFLDTMDAWQAIAPDEAARAAQRAGLVRAIEAVAARFPDARLVVNRGFEVLPQIAPHVSAVAAESLYKRWRARERRYDDVPPADREWLLARLAEVRDRYRLPTIAIDYLPPREREGRRETAARIASHGIVPYVTDGALESIGVGTIETMPRRVLVLHDHPPEYDEATSDPQRFLAMPLHWLGYRVELHNVRERPPPARVLADRYAGVVAWFNGNTAGRGWDLVGWMREARAQGLRIAFVSGFGAPLEGGLGTLLGLAPATARVHAPLAVGARDPIVGHEAQPAPSRAELLPLVARDVVRPLLRIGDARGATFDAAAITRWGGFVLAPFAVAQVPGSDQQRWVVDPFEFLRGALALPSMPVPDPTTETGRRVLMVHVDGDGFASRAELPGAPFAAEVMLREFVARYPVPHTISVIQGETAGTGVYAALSAALEPIARRLFALPHVESASHTYSHPFYWRDAVAGRSDRRYALAVPGYTFDLGAELGGSAGYVDTLLPAGRPPTRVLLWSGDCAPPPVAIARAWTDGLLNMNGGETTITRSNPSLTAVAPMSVRKGGWLQVFAPNQNENVYTNLWTGPFWGFERAIETFELTGSPRRLKPVDIYYHTYSASKPASIAALRKVYDWALAQPLHPIPGSAWIRRIVDFEGFVVAREVAPPHAWRFVGDGALRTVRVPDDVATDVDWRRSDAIAGVRAGADGRWLHLTAPVARLVPTAPGSTRGEPVVVEANGRIDALRREPGRMTFRFSPAVAGELVLSHPRGCRVEIDGRAAPGRPAASIDRLQSGHDATRYVAPAEAGAGGSLVSIRCAG